MARLYDIVFSMDMVLAINSLGHLLVDALCAAAIFGPVAAAGNLTTAVWLYNTLAFSTQCAVGLLTDRLARHDRLAAAALAVTALGLLLPLPWLARIVTVGLGNSVFHVAGGTVTLKRSAGKAGPLGVFVAPGAIGLALGTIYPALGPYLAAAALLLCLPMAFEQSRSRRILDTRDDTGAPSASPLRRIETPWLAVAALLAAVAARAVGGSTVSFPWKTGPALALVTVGFVFAGKAAGGYLCDRLGAKRTALLSLPAAAVLIAFCSAWMLPALAGQFLLNLTMPVTLWLIYRAIPDSPGLAFGLAASALWPGAIAGGLFRLTGPALWLCVLVTFLSGLLAILYSDEKVKVFEMSK